MGRDVYQEVTDRIVAEIEAGCPPWERPWKAPPGVATASGMPYNGSTGRPYNGANVLLLWCRGYSDARWYTMRQANKLGARVRKGEHPTLITFWKKIEKEKNGEDQSFFMLRFYLVFNREQLHIVKEGVDDLPVYETTMFDAEAVFVSADVDIMEGSEAFYDPNADTITLPRFSSFVDEAAYYECAFHEIAHSTGHEKRLDRGKIGRYGSDTYALEELVAEMASAFVCAQTGVPHTPRHAGYLTTWLAALKADAKLIFSVASAARKASEYILAGVTSDEEDEGGDE